MVFATRLRAYREMAVLTQRELADRAGLAELSISKIENGQQQPRPATLRKLAKALRIKPQDLIDVEDGE